MRQASTTFCIGTPGPGTIEFTDRVRQWLEQESVVEGLLTLHIRHTSASLLLQENADPQVQRDLERFFRRLVPPGDPLFEHVAEGPDDMPAHVRCALTTTQLSIPVVRSRMVLGTWQGIFLFEHRDHPHRREVAAHFLGE